MMIAAPGITDAQVLKIDWSVDTFMPTFDGNFFLSLSILVLRWAAARSFLPM